MPNNHIQQAYPVRPQVPHGKSLETWLIRAGHPPATAALITALAGFRRLDDSHVHVVDNVTASKVKEARHG